MVKKIILSATFLSGIAISAQNTGIGTTKPNATLEVKGNATSTTTPDGVIPPQLTRAQLIAKTAYGWNQRGAMVYVTDLTGTTNTATTKVDKAGFYYFDGSAWQKAGGDQWSLTGNAGTDPSVNFIGTTDYKDIIFKRNNAYFGKIGYLDLALGKDALGSATTDGGNLAIGFEALKSAVGLYQNTGIGLYTLRSLTNGSHNTALGRESLINLTDGTANVAVGHLALGQQKTGYKNIAIGFGVDVPDFNGNHQLSIGNSIYGRNINDGNATNDLIGISATDPAERLDVNGNIKSRTINSNTGAATDKVVVADSNGVLKSVDRSGFAPALTNSTTNSVVGNQIQRSALTGDVTADSNSNTTTIAPNAVTSAKILDGTIQATDFSSMGASQSNAIVWDGIKWSPTPIAKSSGMTFDRTRSYAIPGGVLKYDATQDKIFYYGDVNIYWGGDTLPPINTHIMYGSSNYDPLNAHFDHLSRQFGIEILTYQVFSNGIGTNSTKGSVLLSSTSPLSPSNFLQVINSYPWVFAKIRNENYYLIIRLNTNWFIPLD